jgi:DNA-binding PadR family transcriptional regulator
MMRFRHGFDFGCGGPFFRFRGFEKGDIKYVILDLVGEKPRHGYEIIKELESRFYGFYSPSPGTVYPTLQLLEELGWVKSHEEEGKKVYEITDKGQAELKERKEKLGGIWDRVDNWGSFRMGDLNDLFEDLADLKKFVRMKMHSRRGAGLNNEKLKKIRQIIVRAKEEILVVLKS